MALATTALAQLDSRKTVSDVPILTSRVAPPPPSTSPSLEAARLQAVRSLAATFHEVCADSLGGRKAFAHFEQWLWAARTGEDGIVPVLPAKPAAAATVELRDKLIKAGVQQTVADASCHKIAARAAELSNRVAAAACDDAVRVSVRSGAAGEPLLLVWGETEVQCSAAHLEKLHTLFRERAAAESARRQKKRKKHGAREEAASSGDPASAATSADSAAFCAVARLLALQGGEPKAGGNQAACPGALFDALRADFGVTMEAFASPLNCRFPRFCSAAHDCDAQLGGAGSFFSYWPRSGGFLANPPFVPPLVSRMAEHLSQLLEAASTAGGLLLFVVVVPYWPDKPCWQLLQGSKHTTATLRLAQAEHGYYEGGQHYRPALWKPATHDTSVFFLHSAKARACCPLTASKERRLREAFRQPPLLQPHQAASRPASQPPPRAPVDEPRATSGGNSQHGAGGSGYPNGRGSGGGEGRGANKCGVGRGGGCGGSGRGQGNAYADKATQRLDPLKGPRFKKSMMKSKRSTYSGGAIDKHAVNSTRLAE